MSDLTLKGPKRKRRKFDSSKLAYQNKNSFIKNSKLSKDQVDEMIDQKDMKKLKSFLSRGQRKRIKKYEKKRQNDKIIEKIKKDFNLENKLNPYAKDYEEKKQKEEDIFLNMNEIEDTIDVIEKGELGRNKRKVKQKRKNKYRGRNRTRTMRNELNHFMKVVSLPQFQNNPSGAIEQHLTNKIALENQKLMDDKPIVNAKKITGKKRKRQQFLLECDNTE